MNDLTLFNIFAYVALGIFTVVIGVSIIISPFTMLRDIFFGNKKGK